MAEEHRSAGVWFTLGGAMATLSAVPFVIGGIELSHQSERGGSIWANRWIDLGLVMVCVGAAAIIWGVVLLVNAKAVARQTRNNDMNVRLRRDWKKLKKERKRSTELPTYDPRPAEPIESNETIYDPVISTKIRYDENDPNREAGIETLHKSGRRDAVAKPATVAARADVPSPTARSSIATERVVLVRRCEALAGEIAAFVRARRIGAPELSPITAFMQMSKPTVHPMISRYENETAIQFEERFTPRMIQLGNDLDGVVPDENQNLQELRSDPRPQDVGEMWQVKGVLEALGKLLGTEDGNE